MSALRAVLPWLHWLRGLILDPTSPPYGEWLAAEQEACRSDRELIVARILQLEARQFVLEQQVAAEREWGVRLRDAVATRYGVITP